MNGNHGPVAARVAGRYGTGRVGTNRMLESGIIKNRK